MNQRGMHSSSSSTSSSRGSGHQSIEEQHFAPTSNCSASPPPSQSDDGDVSEHQRPSSVSRSSSSCSNNNNVHNNNGCLSKLFLSFVVTFVAVHHILQLLLFMTTSQSSQSSSAVVRAKRCVETEPNIFHCTDNTTPIRSNSESDGTNSNSHRQFYEEGIDGIIMHNKEENYDKYRGVNQNVSGNDEETKKMVEVLHSMEQYWNRWVLTTASIKQQYDEIYFANICTNKHERCVFWASVGECTNNPNYMTNECTLACQVCEKFLKFSVSSVGDDGGDICSKKGAVDE